MSTFKKSQGYEYPRYREIHTETHENETAGPTFEG